MAEPRWWISVAADRCAGTGVCAATRPDHFQVEDGLSRPLAAEVEAAPSLLAAAEGCPMDAIFIRDARTGERLVPEE
ncbi:ferredoxin [Actinomadura graeca]|uniref:Ferredoxin n=1 Tax=Actinomadura graeca TaxID=2750812 RepID=A0ABX8R112_9ACTN|nr:ferredoxin [Actinomadura graeca]QXJ23397.1 ferredoxin [Actinomadura graeca]